MSPRSNTQRKPGHQSTTSPRGLLRRVDQAMVAGLTLAALVAIAAWWTAQGGWQGRLIEVDRQQPRVAHYVVDINQADWPELAQLPEIGETLARRIVESRERQGPFADHEQLLRVRGIGPRTLERMRPYLRPMPLADNVAGR
jgi:competence protein ComEA